MSDLKADRFDENVVFATFDNHQREDFKPYMMKSADKGKTWVSIAANLPTNASRSVGTVCLTWRAKVQPLAVLTTL